MAGGKEVKSGEILPQPLKRSLAVMGTQRE